MKLCHNRIYITFKVLSALLFGLVALAATEKVFTSSDFEPIHPSDHTYPMAVVLYDEEKLTPFQKELREFQFKNIKVSIKQKWNEIGVAAVVWDAVSFSLLTYSTYLTNPG